jgi:dolichol-phosphate mannosyltransferase
MVCGVSVVTTTWNERENIQALVAAVRAALEGVPCEVVVVDDSSVDGTFEAAQQCADVAVQKPREGQSKGLLAGMRLARFPFVVTIDADLENDPKCIPDLVGLAEEGFDLVVACRDVIPRFSERFASKTLGRLVWVRDVFSNFRVYRQSAVQLLSASGGEMFGADFLVLAKRGGLRVGEFSYVAPPRRRHPRIGGLVRANLRILWATLRALWLYWTSGSVV